MYDKKISFIFICLNKQLSEINELCIYKLVLGYEYGEGIDTYIKIQFTFTLYLIESPCYLKINVYHFKHMVCKKQI